MVPTGHPFNLAVSLHQTPARVSAGMVSMHHLISLNNFQRALVSPVPPATYLICARYLIMI